MVKMRMVTSGPRVDARRYRPKSTCFNQGRGWG